MDKIDELIGDAAELAVNEMCKTGELGTKWTVLGKTYQALTDCVVTFEPSPELQLVPIKFELILNGGSYEEKVKLNAKEIGGKIRTYLQSKSKSA